VWILAAGVVFHAGFTFAQFRRLRRDVNGMGHASRSREARGERRWRGVVAVLLEHGKHKMRGRLLELLRDD
jgi:hypothetical protein